jgi:hypothetical protein
MSKYIFVTMCGIYVAAVGTLGMVGHLAKIPALYDWSFHVGMAYGTATGFVVTGAAVIVLGRLLK